MHEPGGTKQMPPRHLVVLEQASRGLVQMPALTAASGVTQSSGAAGAMLALADVEGLDHDAGRLAVAVEIFGTLRRLRREEGDDISRDPVGDARIAGLQPAGRHRLTGVEELARDQVVDVEDVIQRVRSPR